MNIKIMVASHKQCKMPNISIYLPLHVGKELHPEINFGYQGDNTETNISNKNPYFCELTALYWGWKNLDTDYMGLVHYRRYLGLKKEKEKINGILTTEQAEALCKKYNIILPQKRRYYIESLWSHYAHTHDISHLEKTRGIIAKTCPEYIPAFDKVMKRTWGHMFNMFIMKKTLADEYCTWLFNILFQLEKEIDLSTLPAFDARLFGRVSELLLDVWIEKISINTKK